MPCWYVASCLLAHSGPQSRPGPMWSPGGNWDGIWGGEYASSLGEGLCFIHRKLIMFINWNGWCVWCILCDIFSHELRFGNFTCSRLCDLAQTAIYLGYGTVALLADVQGRLCWTLLHSASIFIQTQLTFHCHCNIVAPAAAHWSFRRHLVGPVIFSLETNYNSSNSNYNKQICMAPWGRKFFGGFCPCCSVWVLCRRFQFQFADTFSFVLTLCFQMLLWRSVCVRLSLCLDGFGCILRRTSYSPSLNGCETAFKWTDYYSVVFRFCYGIFHTVLDQILSKPYPSCFALGRILFCLAFMSLHSLMHSTCIPWHSLLVYFCLHNACVIVCCGLSV